MSPIITLQQISDVDTITLQEKLEELETDSIQNGDIISIVRLQLNQRYKVQQFGMMLINNQFQYISDLQVKYQKPSYQDYHKQQIQKQEIKLSKKKKSDIENLLKRSLVSNDTIISKPALTNYRFMPKSQASDSNIMKKNSAKIIGNKKDKKSSKHEKNRNSNRYQKKASIQLPPINKQNSKSQVHIKQSRSSRISPQQKIQQHRISPKKSQTIQINNQQIQIQLIQKIQKKNEQKQSSIKFIQNDVYDQKRLKCCQNLGQIMKKMSQDASQSMSDSKIQADSKIQGDSKIQVNNLQEQTIQEEPIKQQLAIQQNQEQINQKQFKILDSQQIQNKDEKIIEQFQDDQQIKHNLQFSTQIFYKQQQRKLNTVRAQIQNEVKVEKIPQNQFSSTSIRQDAYIQSQHQSDILIKKNKVQTIRIKSHSMKNMKPSGDLQQKQDISHVQFTKIQPIKINQNIQIPKQNKTDRKNSSSRFLKPNRKVDKILITTTAHNYQSIIPNFAKLFPHSSNLITDLRLIEQQLQKHVTKNVLRASLQDQYLRIRQSQLLCQTISQCEKSRKYQYLFDIDLSHFLVRGQKMLRRIKKQSPHPNQQDTLLYRVVRQKQDVYDIVNNCFHRTDSWFQLPHGMDLKSSWNLLWTWSRPQIQLNSLCYFQKVNHFFGNKEIARKDLLKKNIERIKKLGKHTKKAFDIIPQTFYLPGQNMQFIRKFRQCQAKGELNYWILKPVGMSRGRGIQLINKIEDIVFNQPIVLQKYLLNPLLLNGYKFDMRIYVLVTSINPLEAYIYKEGFARISTQKYSNQQQKITDKLIHLTNFSVQKENLDDKKSQKKTFDEQIGGCKITLKMLRQKLQTKGINWNIIDTQIHSIVLKSLISAMSVIQPNPNCFELFGYDIIADQNLKCWLIQINSSPSLQKQFVIDQVLKQQLVDDTIQLVNPLPYDRARLLEVISRRRKQLQGYKSHIKSSNNSNQQLNIDIDYILHGRKIIGYGERGEHKNFIKIAPSQLYSNTLKIVQQYKRDKIERQY